VVAGSGPGGSVAARRLADAGYRVLLLERGKSYANCPACAVADEVFDVGGTVTALLEPFEPEKYIKGNPVFTGTIANVQGGGSSHNGMIWMRPNGAYYFNTFWPPGWHWDDMIPYYMKVENYTYPNRFYGPANNFNYAANLRGNSGLVGIQQMDTTYGNLAGDTLNYAKTIWPNVPVIHNNSINNGYFPGMGISTTEISNISNVRSSSWSSYIMTYTGNNLKYVNFVRANRVIFDGTTVVGIEIVEVNMSNIANSSTCVVQTDNVIVAGGVFGSPQLLQLSGIGPRRVLEPLGIPVVVDSPNVGTHYDDQYGLLSLFNGVGIPIPYRVGGLVFWNVDDDPTGGINIQVNLESGEGLGFGTPYLVYAESKGTVFIKSKNADVFPAVNGNYLEHPHDRYVLAHGLNQTLAYFKLMGLTPVTDPCANANCSDVYQLMDAYIAANLSEVGDHWSATVGVGRALDPATLRVYGTTGLYTLDSSIFVRSPGCHTQYTTYAVAERGIVLIKADIAHRAKRR